MPCCFASAKDLNGPFGCDQRLIVGAGDDRDMVPDGEGDDLFRRFLFRFRLCGRIAQCL